MVDVTNGYVIAVSGTTPLCINTNTDMLLQETVSLTPEMTQWYIYLVVQVCSPFIDRHANRVKYFAGTLNVKLFDGVATCQTEFYFFFH